MMAPELLPNSRQILEALDASKLISEPFVERLSRLGFERADPTTGVSRFRRGPETLALLFGPEGSIGACVYFPESFHFTVGTAILMVSALSTEDVRLNATGVVLVAAGVSRSGLTLPAHIVRTLRQEAQASAQRSVRDRIIDVVALQCHVPVTDIADGTQLEDMCDELDMIEIVSSLEEIYGVGIDGLDDWDPVGSSDVITVGDLIRLVGPQLK